MDRRHLRGMSGDTGRTLVSGRSTRKRLLLDILDCLNELNNESFEEDDTIAAEPAASCQDKSADISSQHDLKSPETEAFLICQGRINDLKNELENLENTFRKLGSAGMTSPSYRLRMRLSVVLGLFRKNTTELFPKSKHQLPDPSDIPWSAKWNLKLDSFPEELEHLAKDLTTFLEDLYEFPELTHEPLKESVMAFTGKLEYWAYCLQDFKGQFQKDPAVQRYMQDICGRMDSHLNEITVGLHSFTEVVVPAINVAKQQTATTFLSLSSLATFMSAVTATGIQMVFNSTDSPADNAVNAFWFSSLVFSVASAVNSLLGLAWSQSPYRSPHTRVPWWISMWIRRSPLVFLVISLVAFSVGLVLFTWASKQHLITCLLTTFFTGIGFFSLLSVSIWFALEQSTFVHHNGRHLLVDVLADLNSTWANHHPVYFIQHAYIHSKTQVIQIFSNITRMFSGTSHLENATDSALHSDNMAMTQLSVSSAQTLSQPSPHSDAALDLDSSNLTSKHSLAAPVTPQHTEIKPQSIYPGSTAELTVAKLQKTSVDIMKATRTISVHNSSVSNVQFSPDGKRFATCSHGQDRTSVLFHVGDGDTLIPYETLAHSFSVRRVEWAPRGGHLITLQLYDINIWKEDGSYVNTIVQHPFVESVTWLQSGNAFLALSFSLNGTDVKTMDLNGNILATHHLPRLDLCDIAITPDDLYMLSVGNLIESASSQQLQEKKEARITLYNMAAKKIESQVPITLPLQNIIISANGQFALASSSDGSTNNPAQLWELENDKGIIRLSLQCTYTPSTDFIFPSRTCFGGKEDQLVICAGGGGHVDIWDRESGELLRTLHPDGNLTCAAWNTAPDAAMLATGSTDGNIRIWTAPVPVPIRNIPRSALVSWKNGERKSRQTHGRM